MWIIQPGDQTQTVNRVFPDLRVVYIVYYLVLVKTKTFLNQKLPHKKPFDTFFFWLLLVGKSDNIPTISETDWVLINTILLKKNQLASNMALPRPKSKDQSCPHHFCPWAEVSSCFRIAHFSGLYCGQRSRHVYGLHTFQDYFLGRGLIMCIDCIFVRTILCAEVSLFLWVSLSPKNQNRTSLWIGDCVCLLPIIATLQALC